jgi:hypothetical protein
MERAQTEVPDESILDISFAKYQLLEGGIHINVPAPILSSAGLRDNNSNQYSRTSTRQNKRNNQANANTNTSTSTNASASANTNNRTTSNKNTNSSTVYHRNQPKPLHVTNSTFARMVGPAVANGSVDVPKFKDKNGKESQQCMRYALRGHCVADCHNADSHVPVQPGQRQNELLELRRQLKSRWNETRGPNDPDFQ